MHEAEKQYFQLLLTLSGHGLAQIISCKKKSPAAMGTPPAEQTDYF